MSVKLEKIEFEKYDQRKRAALINGLSGFKSANLLGTKSQDQLENLCIVSSCFHIGANPALMGVIIRPSTTERDRHSLENILETKFCTLNHITEQMMEKAHQTSARYPRHVSEFTQVGLDSLIREDFFAPFVKDSPVQLGLELREHHHLSINSCEMLILEIKCLFTDAHWIQPDGHIDLEAAGSLCVSGLDSYHKTQRISRLSYAKPEKWPTKIPLEGI